MLPSPTTVCRQSTGPPGNALLPKFCLHELILQQAHSTLLGDWLHKPHLGLAVLPPFRTSSTTKPTPPDHASFSRTSRSTRSLLHKTPPVQPGRPNQLLSPPTELVSTTFLAGEKLWRGTPHRCLPCPNTGSPQRTPPQKDQWTIDELTHSGPAAHAACVHHQRHRPRCQRWILQEQLLHLLLRSGRNHQSPRSKASTEHLDHPETNLEGRTRDLSILSSPSSADSMIYHLGTHHHWTDGEGAQADIILQESKSQES
jgi:hypothetical protein